MTTSELADVAKSGRSWTRLRREAGLPTKDGGVTEDSLLRRVRAVAHVDDAERAAAYLALLSDNSVPYGQMGARQQAFARMLLFLLFPDAGGFSSFEAGFAALAREPAAREELAELISLSLDQSRHLPSPLAGRLHDSQLQVHARYQREEILSALGHATLQRLPSYFREGVMRSDEMDLDAFFVTLRKTETDYSPTTMYQDYGISPTLFHWESQSTTTAASKTGQRYLNHRSTGSEILIFSRAVKLDALGTMAYTSLGAADYVAAVPATSVVLWIGHVLSVVSGIAHLPGSYVTVQIIERCLDVQPTSIMHGLWSPNPHLAAFSHASYPHFAVSIRLNGLVTDEAGRHSHQPAMLRSN